MTIAEIISAAHKYGLTMEQLAERAEVHVRTIYRLQRRPTKQVKIYLKLLEIIKELKAKGRRPCM